MTEPIDGTGTSLEEIARAFHERSGDWASFLHPDVEVRVLMTHDRAVKGREAVVEALSTGREVSLYSGRVTRVEAVGPDVLLVSGNVRYALEGGGVGHGSATWLDEFRGGLLWRARYFRSAEEALAAVPRPARARTRNRRRG